MQNTQHYVPAGYVPTFEGHGLAIYHDPVKLVSLAYPAKGKRPVYHVIFKTAEAMEAHDLRYIESRKASEKAKAERKAERAKPHSLQKGDILYTSWGWEQTNVEFYKVLDTKPHSVLVVEVGLTSVEATGWASDKVVAAPEILVGEPVWKRCDGHGHVKFRHNHASKWDGTPRHRSWYA